MTFSQAMYGHLTGEMIQRTLDEAAKERAPLEAEVATWSTEALRACVVRLQIEVRQLKEERSARERLDAARRYFK